MIEILNISFIAFIIYSIWEKQDNSPIKKYFFPAFGLKLLAGISVGLLYYYHYGYGDTIGYHLDAVGLCDLLIKDINEYYRVMIGSTIDSSQFIYGNQSRAFFLVKILSLFHLLTGQNYWISGLYFSLFSFTGFWMFASSLCKHFPSNKLAIVISTLFFPSVVFWSSGVIKESLAMGALVMLFSFLINWNYSTKFDLKRIVFSTLLICLVWQLKYYYLGVFLLVAAPFVFTKIISRIKKFRINTYLLFGILLVNFGLIVSILHPNFNLSRIMLVIVENHDLYVVSSKPDQLIHYQFLKPTLNSVIYNLPQAVWSGLFRMGVWEANQLLEYLVGMENLLLLVFALSTFYGLPKLKFTNSLLILSAGLYVVLLAGFLALSAPNLGTLTRYKIGFLPIFLLLFTMNNPLIGYIQSKFSTKVEDIT